METCTASLFQLEKGYLEVGKREVELGVFGSVAVPLILLTSMLQH